MSAFPWRRLSVEDDGISLVEVLVSIMILGIALAAFAGTMTSALATITSDEQLVRGNQVAADVVEEARSLPWDCIGFDVSDPDYVGTPATVQIDTTQCTGAAYAARPRVSTDDRTVDGQRYEVTRAIEWVDAPGVPGTQNHKRVTVVVDWTVRGNPYTTSTASIRVPTPTEVPVSAPTEESCTPGSISRLSVTPTIVAITTSGRTNERISVVVETCSPSSLVTLNPRPHALSILTEQAGSGGMRWELVPAFNVGTENFQPGDYDWTATATPSDSAVTSEVDQAMTFFVQDTLVPLDVSAITPAAGFCVDSSGSRKNLLRNPVPVSIAVQGMNLATQGTVTLQWTSVNASATAVFQSASGDTSTWTTTVPAGTRFTGTSTTLSAVATRLEDNASAPETIVQQLTLRNHNVAC